MIRLPTPDKGKRRAALGLGLGFVGLVGLVTWLFVRAGEVSPDAHYTYVQSLRRVKQADVELNAAVLANYADLNHNYDAAVRHLREIGEERPNIVALPVWIQSEALSALNEKLNELFAAQLAKAREVDLFQRSNAVLRNSLLYFPQAAESCLRDAGPAARAELGAFVRAVLALGQGPDREVAGQVRRTLEALERRLGREAGPSPLGILLLHARVIVEQRPEVDRLMLRILRAPTAELHEELTRLYDAGYVQAVGTAATYRRLLFAVAMLLALYVIYAVLRIDRDRRDLAQRLAAQRRAEAQVRLYARVFTSATEGMTVTDADAKILAVNPAFCQITGYSAEEVIGRTPAILSSGRQGRDFYRQMWAELIENGQWHGEIWNRRKDGGIYPEWLSLSAVREGGAAVSHYIGVFTDISERKQNEERIKHLAHHDALTGLPNRLLLEDRVAQAVIKARRHRQASAVIFIDLDRFKNINDTLGHEVGDQLLIQAAQRASRLLRDTDTMSRLGGDEFVVVLPELDQVQDAMHVARKMLAAIGQPYLLAGHTLTVTGSAGIALCPDDGQTVSDLLRKADAAMYRAKAEGRNTVRFYADDINTASLGELLLENDLRGALERGELLMYYQPKVEAGSGRLIGAEALMRWRHPVHGLLSPARFIPLAEESGLIGALGEWAIDDVCRQQRAWLEAGRAAVPVAVNVSAHQFAQQDVPQLVAEALRRYRLPPALLTLELTESLLMRNAGRAAEILRQLRAMAIDVAIDDFGTGYSSLSYLNQFPLQALKIDRAFVCEIGMPGTAVKLVSAMIAMAHELDLQVIAEGVETEVQSAYLRAHGCDQFQGFLFGRPQAAEAMGELLPPAAA